jgi:hypothetical protein
VLLTRASGRARSRVPSDAVRHRVVDCPPMTLILSYISREFVIQVSDQLLVTRHAGKWRPLRDPVVKSVVADGRVAFASTGLAQVPRSPAAQAGRNLPAEDVGANLWLAEVLALPDDPREIPQRLVEETSSSYAKLTSVPLDLRQQALMGVGWFSVDGGALEPVSIKITNMNPARQFEATGVRLDGGARAHLEANRPLNSPRLIPLRRRIAQCVNRRVGPKPVARTLIAVARAIAATDETVGDDLILSCIPRNQVVRQLDGAGWVLEEGEPSLRGVSFQHLPAGTHVGKTFSPTVVLGGLVAHQMHIAGGVNIQMLPPGSLSHGQRDDATPPD